jgi:hypothetical protein
VNEEGWPGAIQIWKFPLEKMNEVQAHSAGIERMCLTFDNKTLITASLDGSIMIHEVIERDTRGVVGREFEFGYIPTYSEEIMTDKGAMEEYERTLDLLRTELNQVKDPSAANVDEKMTTKE